MAEKQHIGNQQRLGKQEANAGRDHRWLLLGGAILLFLFLIVVTTGCGPKGFIKGEAYSENGVILGNQKLLVKVAGKSYVVVSGLDGTFKISGIALGNHRITVTFKDPDTGEQHRWDGTVKVGIQGGTVKVEFTIDLEGFDQQIQAVWRCLLAEDWEAVRVQLESLTDQVDELQQQSICELAWGWLYLRSGEDYERAKQHFSSALSLGRLTDAKVGLAGVEAATGMYQAAVSQLEQALQSEPQLELGYLGLNSGDLGVALANLYLQSGDDTKALDTLHRRTQGASPKGQKVANQLLQMLEG